MAFGRSTEPTYYNTFVQPMQPVPQVQSGYVGGGSNTPIMQGSGPTNDGYGNQPPPLGYNESPEHYQQKLDLWRKNQPGDTGFNNGPNWQPPWMQNQQGGMQGSSQDKFKAAAEALGIPLSNARGHQVEIAQWLNQHDRPGWNAGANADDWIQPPGEQGIDFSQAGSNNFQWNIDDPNSGTLASAMKEHGGMMGSGPSNYGYNAGGQNQNDPLAWRRQHDIRYNQRQPGYNGGNINQPYGQTGWGSFDRTMQRSPMQVGGDPSQAQPGMQYLMGMNSNNPGSLQGSAPSYPSSFANSLGQPNYRQSQMTRMQY